MPDSPTFRRRSVAALALAAALGCPAAATASGWGPSTVIGGMSGRYPVTAAATAGGGYALAVAGPLALLPGTPQVPLAWSTAPAQGGFTAPALFTHGLSAPLAISPGGTAIAVGGPRSPLDYFSLEGRSAAVRVGIGSAGGAFKLVPTRGLRASLTLAAAVNDRGDAALVLSRCIAKDCARRMILASFRRAGGAFGAPVVLARRTGVPAGAVALNARGDAIVAWAQQRADRHGYLVRVRLHRAGGSLTAVRTAATVAPRPTLAVTLSTRGRGNVAWFTGRVSKESEAGRYRVATRLLDSRGTLHGTRTLDAGTPSGHGEDDAIPGPRLRAVADGAGALIAWTGLANGRYIVRASHVVDDVASNLVLAPTGVDARLQDIAIDRDGDAIVGWVTGTDVRPGVAGATMRVGYAGTFGAPRALIPLMATAAVAIAPGPCALLAAGGVAGINSTMPVSTTRYTP